MSKTENVRKDSKARAVQAIIDKFRSEVDELRHDNKEKEKMLVTLVDNLIKSRTEL